MLLGEPAGALHQTHRDASGAIRGRPIHYSPALMFSVTACHEGSASIQNFQQLHLKLILSQYG